MTFSHSGQDEMAVNREAVPWSMILGRCELLAAEREDAHKRQKAKLGIEMLMKTVGVFGSNQSTYSADRISLILARLVAEQVCADFGKDARDTIVEICDELQSDPTKRFSNEWKDIHEIPSSELAWHMWYVAGHCIRIQEECVADMRDHVDNETSDVEQTIPDEWKTYFTNVYGFTVEYQFLRKFDLEKTVYTGFVGKMIHDMPHPHECRTVVRG